MIDKELFLGPSKVAMSAMKGVTLICNKSPEFKLMRCVRSSDLEFIDWMTDPCLNKTGT